MVVPPGATIGIFGGGQLGRMLALAARPMGYRVLVLDPDADCAARPVVDGVIAASFDDAEAARKLARQCAVITAEIEKIGREALAAASAHAPLRPGAELLAMVQDRGVQKRWLAQQRLPLAEFRVVEDAAALGAAGAALGDGAFIKTCRGGYDGRGQARWRPGGDPAAVFAALGGQACVVERAVPLERELSVLVARRPGGEVVTYAPAHNHHERQILAWSVLPAPIPKELAQAAQELARSVAVAARLEGLLAVEMFVSQGGELLINELAPRPHNSYHGSELGCLTSQFEQGIRAACDLPLGSVDVLRPTAIHNLLGDLWAAGEPSFAAALVDPDVKLRLYGKGTPRPGRKMGHLVAAAATGDEALAKVQRAYTALGQPRLA